MNNLKNKSVLFAFAMAGGAFTCVAQAAVSSLDITYTTSSTTLLTPGVRIVGFDFTVPASGATITALDYDLNTGETSSLVQLYNAAGTIFGSATVTTADPTTTTGTTPVVTYYVHTLPVPITLAAGTYYVTGATATNTVVPYGVGSPTSLDPSVSYIANNANSGVYNNPGTFTTQPTPTTNAQGLTNSYFNVNIGVLSTAAVPEPTSIGAVLIGATTLLARRRRR